MSDDAPPTPEEIERIHAARRLEQIRSSVELFRPDIERIVDTSLSKHIQGLFTSMVPPRTREEVQAAINYIIEHQRSRANYAAWLRKAVAEGGIEIVKLVGSKIGMVIVYAIVTWLTVSHLLPYQGHAP